MQLSNASRKGVQAAVGILFSEKIPSPACRVRVAERVTGFCLFNLGVNKVLQARLLCAISVALCVSVVGISWRIFTTEAQRATEDTQRKTLIEDSPARS